MKNDFFKQVMMTVSSVSMIGSSVADEPNKQPLKIGFGYVGPVGDFGWSYQHD